MRIRHRSATKRANSLYSYRLMKARICDGCACLTASCFAAAAYIPTYLVLWVVDGRCADLWLPTSRLRNQRWNALARSHSGVLRLGVLIARRERFLYEAYSGLLPRLVHAACSPLPLMHIQFLRFIARYQARLPEVRNSGTSGFGARLTLWLEGLWTPAKHRKPISSEPGAVL